MKLKIKNPLKNINLKGLKNKESKTQTGNFVKRKGKMRLITMLVMIAIMPVVLCSLILSAYSTSKFKKGLESNARDTLYIVSSNLASHCADEKISYSTADRFNDYLDGLKDHGIEMSILIMGTPSVTSIKNENGYRMRDIVVRDEVYANPDFEKDGVYIDGFEVEGIQYVAHFKPLIVDGEQLGAVMSAIPKSTIDEQIADSRRTVIVVSITCVVLISIILLFIAQEIKKTFVVINTNMKNLADGRLGKSIEKNSKVQEFMNLVDASKDMNVKLENIIGNVQNASDDLAGDVRNVTQLSESNADRAENIAAAIRELADSTTDMAEYVGDITNQMVDMGDSITNISESVDQLNSKSETLMSANDDARRNIDLILEGNSKAFYAVNDIAKQIKETNESIANINAAVDIILGIANKTKLLSLNASIEAARAGEAGRGFAVVADEIRQLSEQSSQGAESIRRVAQTIVEESQKSVELADEVYDLMNSEKESVKQAGISYEQLAKNINESAEEIRQIAVKTDNLTEAKQIVLTNVEKLAALSEQNAAGNQSVTNDVEIITNDAKTIFDNCDNMNRLAEELKDTIAYFSL